MNNKVYNDFEIVEGCQPKKGKFSVYFIETHLKKHDKEIKISLDKDNKSFEGLEKIHQEEITNNNRMNLKMKKFVLDFLNQNFEHFLILISIAFQIH